MSINRVCISGNLTRDAEVRQTQSGVTLISFGVAVNDRRRNQQTGEWESVPNYVDCVMFDRNGNKQWMANAMRKGFRVFVEGALHYSSWQDRDTGKNRSKLEVIVHDIDANWPKRDQTQGYPPQQHPQRPQGYQQQPQSYGQPVSAPQATQPANYTQQTQYAPQQAPQPQAAPPQQPAPQPAQQQMQMPPQQQPPADVYDEDIPF